jgi:hypothetical protein
MGTLKAIPAEIIHLFVDDGSLALALVAWCGAIGLATMALPESRVAAGVALFLGCALILFGNVLGTARSRARTAARH